MGSGTELSHFLRDFLPTLSILYVYGGILDRIVLREKIKK